MSLVASASIWNNDETTNKKRQSTMRKTIKLRSNNQEINAYNDSKLEYENTNKEYENINKEYKTNSIDEQQEYNSSRNKRVNDLLNKITTIDNNDDNKMGDFKPLSHPSINVKKDIDNPNPGSRANINYKSNDNVSNIFSSYKKSYEPPSEIVNKPYYLASISSSGLASNLGSSSNSGLGLASNLGYNHSSGSVSSISHNNNFNDKIMEKLNHMIHLLEESRHEKTANITEEFILYTFLGVFVIFIVDSFSKTKRYTR